MKLTALYVTIAIIGLLSFQSAAALECSADWQCQSVSDLYQAIECNDGQCTCVYDQGFAGSATAEDHCRCAGGNGDITWKNGKAFCLNIEAALADAAKNQRRISHIREIYDNNVWQSEPYGGPASIMYKYYTGLDTSLPDRLFSDDCTGRIKEVGTVANRGESVDYFFGNIDYYAFHWDLIYHVHYAPSLEDSNVILSEVIMRHRGLTAPDGVPFLFWNITQTGHWRFNEQDQITRFDLTIHQLGKATDRFDPEGPIPGTPETDPSYGFTKAMRYCGLYFTPSSLGGAGCLPEHDPEGHYVDFADCVAFVSALPNGSWEDTPMLTQTCMGYHTTRASYNKLHCTHAGKTGGGKCYDHTYESYQADNEKFA